MGIFVTYGAAACALVCCGALVSWAAIPAIDATATAARAIILIDVLLAEVTQLRESPDSIVRAWPIGPLKDAREATVVSSKRCYDAQVMNFLEGESEGFEHSHEESFQGADHLQRRSACERSLTEI